MNQEFYSNGKLLLSGEYAVLDGALAWAIPTTYGQYLRVSSNMTKLLSWRSLDEKGNIWFEGVYTLDNLEEISSSDQNISRGIQNILQNAKLLNPSFLTETNGYAIETALSFPKNWGLGSSSTLINNVAQWATINAHTLLDVTFGGSGYDISCAQYDVPILYTIKNKAHIVTALHESLPFVDSLYFVYLNQKKNSRDGISTYRKRNIKTDELVSQITELTKKMVASSSLEEFEVLMVTHEKILSKALNIPTVKSKLFSDFSGEVKSLGAWGGDFILVTGGKNTPDYFKKKGYPIIVPFQEMIL